ncbi:hypothetical protein MANES_02G221780v8 [Manihot esculenta]|uniref:Uncharacterized protein n=1 Tax=Manihot esculenta TaxID=3983 RepID=A0ACB7ID44_MANES|nr:hypothetical protein MANES_02G221780v8 [Manihot esculenta]
MPADHSHQNHRSKGLYMLQILVCYSDLALGYSSNKVRKLRFSLSFQYICWMNLDVFA